MQGQGIAYDDYGMESSGMSDDSRNGKKDPEKAAIKLEKKAKEKAKTLAMMMPFMMYAGAGRFMLTVDNKRKIIKIAQVQEFFLHTLPLGGLMAYNNMQDVVFNEDIKSASNIFFSASAALSLIEIVYLYCKKVQGVNLEVDLKT